tara:strand:- start:142 stop:546 length:405 start_codon:yes stop_codon:yes gene_type:complete
MFKWRSESNYLSRYVGSGALNTIIGWSVIFLLMAIGTSPILANISGYLLGLVLGFVISKNFVFRSAGTARDEGKRYFIAFVISFIFNLLALQFSLEVLHWNQNVAQVVAAITYTVFMYFLSLHFVFEPNKEPYN